jgi:LmbE family N-acetylglucosaminyl deacetylase
MPTSERMARFATKLAKQIDTATRSQQGASIVAVAQDETHPDHRQALAVAQSAAQALGKGWPRSWPTNRTIPV